MIVRRRGIPATSTALAPCTARAAPSADALQGVCVMIGLASRVEARPSSSALPLRIAPLARDVSLSDDFLTASAQRDGVRRRQPTACRLVELPAHPIPDVAVTPGSWLP